MTLAEFDPAGEWIDNALLLQYLQNSYSLNRGQVREMVGFLRGEVDKATAPERIAARSQASPEKGGCISADVGRSATRVSGLQPPKITREARSGASIEA